MAAIPTLLIPGNLKIEGKVIENEKPIETIVNWIKKRMSVEFNAPPPKSNSDRVLIVKSETGSGKSTVMPVSAFGILKSQTPGGIVYRGINVLCTQPRILNAKTLANEISEAPYFPGMVLGETVGYQTGIENRMPRSGLIFSTIGVLGMQLRVLSDEEIMEKYRIIIIDEAHERSLESDCAIMLLKKFYERNRGRPSLPFLIFASATIDSWKYSRFMGIPTANVFNVAGRAFPIETFWPAHGVNNYVAAIVETVEKIHKEQADDSNDILAFVPGFLDISDTVKALGALNARLVSEGYPALYPIPLQSEVVRKEDKRYKDIFDKVSSLSINIGGKTHSPSRRVIVATNVAETGVTIHTVGHVIDSGWNKSVEIFQPSGVGGLIAKPNPRSRAEQRKGRAGRLFPGKFYPLYTEKVYKQLDEMQYPDIVLRGVDDVFLDVASESVDGDGTFRVELIDMLDPPTVDSLASSIEKAISCGFLSRASYTLTPLGKLARKISLPMEVTRMVLAGYAWNVSIRDLVTMASLIEYRSASDFMLDRKSKTGVGESSLSSCRNLSEAFGKSRYHVGMTPLHDDFIEWLLVFDDFAGVVDRSEFDLATVEKWCAENNLDLSKLAVFSKRRDQIIELLAVNGLDVFRGSSAALSSCDEEDFLETVERLKMCVYESLRTKIIFLDEATGRYTDRYGTDVFPPFRLSDRAIGDAPKPRHVVTNSLAMSIPRNSKNAVYQVKASLVSSLDGFVTYDRNFLAPALI